jgi:mannose-6-phosphate isomerase-like protein (cupin superfamily)
MPSGVFHAKVDAELARLPGPAGERWVSALERGALSIEIYAPRGDDPQQPHTRDEIYVVVSGKSTFVVGGERLACGPGDVVYVPAGVAHRFEGFGDDLVVWGIFFPAVSPALA